MTTQNVPGALERLEEVFLGSESVDALLARREAGRPLADDPRRAQEKVAEIRTTQGPQGAWNANLLTTAESLIRLAELIPPQPGQLQDPTATRAITWLRSRRGAPGRYGEGCTPERHRRGLCHHFLGGFFAPTPPVDTPDQQLVLSCGAIFPAGQAARLVASCRALRALLVWGVYGNDDWLHLEGLRRILSFDPRDSDAPAPLEALPEILSALLAAPPDEANHSAIRTGLIRLIRSQRADGSWPELDIFHILDMLLVATEKGYGDDEVDAALRRAAGQLAVSQQDHGSWERDTLPRRSWIGWRTLRYGVMLEGRTAPAVSQAPV